MSNDSEQNPHTPMKWAPIVFGKPGYAIVDSRLLIAPNLSNLSGQEQIEINEWINEVQKAGNVLYGGELSDPNLTKADIPFIFSRRGRFTLVGITGNSDVMTDDPQISLESASSDSNQPNAWGRPYKAAMLFLTEGRLTEVPIVDPEFYRKAFTKFAKTHFNSEKELHIQNIEKLNPSQFESQIPTHSIGVLSDDVPPEISDLKDRNAVTMSLTEGFYQQLPGAAISYGKPVTIAYCNSPTALKDFRKGSCRIVDILACGREGERKWHYSGQHQKQYEYPSLGEVPPILNNVVPADKKIASPSAPVPAQEAAAKKTSQVSAPPVTAPSDPPSNDGEKKDTGGEGSKNTGQPSKPSGSHSGNSVANAAVGAAAAGSVWAFMTGKGMSTAMAVISPLALIDGIRRLLKKPKEEEKNHSSRDKLIAAAEIISGIALGGFAIRNFSRGR